MVNMALHILETPQEMAAVEDMQRLVWPGNETEVVPAHMLLAAVHNGGLVVGAYPNPDDANQAQHPLPQNLVGFVFGFPGIYETPDGPRLKHCSHMLGVHPDFRDQGVGFILKRAQWQMVRKQGIDRITWTYDPLLSRNAYLNITRLGSVCNTYLENEYGELRDGLNVGLPTDRFQVDWWVNSRRVVHRLGKKPRQQLDLAHFLDAGIEIVNPSQVGSGSLLQPGQVLYEKEREENPAILLLEIPANFQELKALNPTLALEWRLHTRRLFVDFFQRGYLVTDFVHLSTSTPRSFYVLCYGESTL